MGGNNVFCAYLECTNDTSESHCHNTKLLWSMRCVRTHASSLTSFEAAFTTQLIVTITILDMSTASRFGRIKLLFGWSCYFNLTTITAGLQSDSYYTHVRIQQADPWHDKPRILDLFQAEGWNAITLSQAKKMISFLGPRKHPMPTPQWRPHWPRKSDGIKRACLSSIFWGLIEKLQKKHARA